MSNFRQLLGLEKSQLEDMCVNCGLCCYAQIDLGKGKAFIPELRCKHLTVEKNTGKSCCSVYEDRHEKANWCLPLAEAVSKGIFPDQCPYVKDLKSYVGSAILSDEAYQAIRPSIQKAVSEKGKPDWVSDSHWQEFLKTK